jgi:tetratricopeptide (TPR) repeat protein
MNVKRIAVIGAVVLAAVLATLFAGVLAGSDGQDAAASRLAAPAFLVDAGPRASVDRLLAGFSTGDTASFTRALEQNVARHPADVASLTVLGFAYQQLARETGDPTYFTLSERALRRALSLEGEEPLALAGLASLSVGRHRWNDAIGFAKRALQVDRESATALAALGDAYLNLGRYEEAFPILDRVAVLSPSAGSFGRISYARELLGRPEDAIEAIADAAGLNEGVPEHDAWASVQLGNLQFGLGRLKAAEGSYRRALERYPGYVAAEAGLARVEAARGRYAPAAARLRHVLDVQPTPQSAVLLGDVLRAAGETQAAREADALVDAMERLLAANGVRTELQTALFDVDRGRDVAGALERAELAFASAPSVAAEDVLAWALYANGRCAEALGHARHALRLGTLDALMLFHRGMIERCAGREEAGLASIRQALELNPHFSFVYAPVARRILRGEEAA